MTRQEFIERYAANSGVSAEFAAIGILQIGNYTRVALPCNCGDDRCEGWALVGPDGVISQLELYAPEPLKSAYLETISNLEKD